MECSKSLSQDAHKAPTAVDLHAKECGKVSLLAYDTAQAFCAADLVAASRYLPSTEDGKVDLIQLGAQDEAA